MALASGIYAHGAEGVARTGRYTGPATTGKKQSKDEKKPKTIAEIVGSNQKFEGLFTLYQDTTNGTVHLLIKQAQLDREYIYFTQTRDGVLAAGHFRGAFQDNRIFSIHKHFNRIELVSENTAFYFDETNALKRAASANVSWNQWGAQPSAGLGRALSPNNHTAQTTKPMNRKPGSPIIRDSDSNSLSFSPPTFYTPRAC